MPVKIDEVSDTLLFSYTVASAEMRYIEVGERDIFLRSDPELGLVVRGEMPGCGPSCNANLSRILLEYALTCEGCKDKEEAAESAGLFGVRLGKILAAKLCIDPIRVKPIDNISHSFECILNSMGVSYQIDCTPDQLRFSLDESPLHKAARKTGTNRGVSNALRSFIALCRTMLRILAPEWTIQEPSERYNDDPILEVVLAIPAN